MKNFFNQAIADGLNELGYGVDIPNDKGEMKFGPECHEVYTIAEKLNQLIESSPVVYGSKFISNDGSAFDIGSVWNITKISDKTHSARLMFIEEIKKECVKHEPSKDRGWLVGDLICKHCKVPLEAIWQEKK